MKALHFLISALIWVFAFVPVVLMGCIALPFLLHVSIGWDGSTTWWGNTKYPRPIQHHSVTDPTSFWQTYVFYAFRNPASNYGHTVLSSSKVYWNETTTVGKLTFYYGWKEGDAPHTFVFRPGIKS